MCESECCIDKYHVLYLLFGLCGVVKDDCVFGADECLTICLRGIRNAWHFYYALVLVFKVVCSSFSIALLTP
ncbi:hypothetical protein VAE151_700002 [Vibrio aestuarianus]|nr:DUF3265 domain-containing protein [Vibrio aestuarianus subsp. francensis]CAH8241292.1 hypothetical protein VAE151_700002 [Vibrio aestuarianus]